MESTNVALLALALTLLAQLGGVIWGASKFATVVQHLDRVVGRLEAAVNKLDVRVTVLEDRSERNKGQP